jgi:hypothetical protein
MNDRLNTLLRDAQACIDTALELTTDRTFAPGLILMAQSSRVRAARDACANALKIIDAELPSAIRAHESERT